jgi:hypothetical protein
VWHGEDVVAMSQSLDEAGKGDLFTFTCGAKELGVIPAPLAVVFCLHHRGPTLGELSEQPCCQGLQNTWACTEGTCAHLQRTERLSSRSQVTQPGSDTEEFEPKFLVLIAFL